MKTSDKVKQIIEEFKGKNACKFKLIMISEIASPINHSTIETYFNHSFQNILTLQNFDTIFNNIVDQFQT